MRCRPCSWRNLSSAYGRQNKIRYCFSSFNFQIPCITSQSSLKLYIYQKKRKQKKPTSSTMFRIFSLFVVRHRMHARVIMSFTFPMQKNLSKRRLIRKFQPMNFVSKPETEKKRSNMYLRGRNILIAVWIYCSLVNFNRPAISSSCQFLFSLVARFMMLKSAYLISVLKIQNKEVNDVNDV